MVPTGRRDEPRYRKIDRGAEFVAVTMMCGMWAATIGYLTYQGQLAFAIVVAMWVGAIVLSLHEGLRVQAILLATSGIGVGTALLLNR